MSLPDRSLSKDGCLHLLTAYLIVLLSTFLRLWVPRTTLVGVLSERLLRGCQQLFLQKKKKHIKMLKLMHLSGKMISNHMNQIVLEDEGNSLAVAVRSSDHKVFTDEEAATYVPLCPVLH